MPTAGETPGKRYSAFLSYSHRDAAFVRRLHRRLESYRLPASLARRSPEPPARAGRLDPVFRDREEMVAAPDLSDAVRDAIERSRHLIVVCSPASAQSDWVGREVRLFRAAHGEDRILAAVLAGSPPGVFHPALTEPGADGHPHSPVAADFRPKGDGDRLALLKLVAALAEVGLDELAQRDARRQVRRILFASVSTVCALVLVGALGFAVLQGQIAARNEHAAGSRIVQVMGGDLYARIKRFGGLQVRNELDRGALSFYRGKDIRQLAPDDVLQRAKLLQQSGGDNITRGAYAAADAQLSDAEAATGRLLQDAPNDPKRIFAHAQSEFWLGFLRMRQGDDVRAEAAMKAYASLTSRLVAIDPGNLDWRQERGDAATNLGVFLLRRDIDTARAGAMFRSAQADFEAVARARPKDSDAQGQVEDGHGWIATAMRLAGDQTGALKERMAQRRILETLLAADPRDYQTRLRLVSNDVALGRVAAAVGDYASAETDFERAHASAASLSREDPENTDASRQARGSQLFEARTWLFAPLGRRPPRARIAEAIGDCAAGRPKTEEVTDLCQLVRARSLAQDGDRAAATRVADALLAGPLARGERLSEFWLMDLRGEARSVLALTGEGPQLKDQHKGSAL